MNAATFAGAVVMNGNVTIGNASADDLTINASLAASIPVKTTRTYDIGSADVGLRLIYLGGNSTHTAALGAPSSGFSGDTSFLLPTSNGTAYYRLKTDGSGNTSWVPPAPESAAGADADTVLTVSSARTQIVTPTANRIYTMPTTSVLAGDTFTILNQSALANAFTITVKSSDGTALANVFPQNSVVLMALQATPTTPTHWDGLKPIITDWNGVGYGLVAGSFNSAAWGTVTSISQQWRRVGDSVEVKVALRTGTVGGTAASLTLPTGFALDTAKINSTGFKTRFGWVQRVDTGINACGDGFTGAIVHDGSSSTVFNFCIASTTVDSYTAQLGNALFATTENVELSFLYPVSGWSTTKG